MVSINPYYSDLTLTDIRSSTTLTSSYNGLYDSNNGDSVHGDYTFRRKHETNKERLIRERSAFKLFYKKQKYVVRRTEKYFSAENIETHKRENKFKNINLNLII